MLSFSRGKIFLYLVDKDDKIQEKIYYDENCSSKKTDIEVENYLSVLNKYDFKKIKSNHRLSDYDIGQIKKHLKNKSKEKINNGVFLNVYDKLVDIVNDRVGRSLIFDDKEYKNLELVPAIKGYTCLSIVGPSGSGKSTVAAKLINVNKKKDEKIYLLSRQLSGNIDPAFDKFSDDIIEINTHELDDLPTVEDLEKQWLLVDDLEGLHRETREYIYDYINSIVTCGRKLNVKIIFSAHIMSGMLFRIIHNESRYIYMFPLANSNRVKTDLRLKYCMSSMQRNIVMEETRKDKSRWVALGLSNPNCYITTRRIVLD